MIGSIRWDIKNFLRPLMRISGAQRGLCGYMLRRMEEYPRYLQIETINMCNARCVMCATTSMKRVAGKISSELYRKIIDDYAGIVRRPAIIYPFFNGEPLLDRRIASFVQYAKERVRGGRAYISTNGSLLDEEVGAALMEAGLDRLNISFDGVDRETYERIRLNLKFDEVEENIRRFIELRKRRGKSCPEVFLSVIEMEETMGKIGDFVDRWSKVVDRVTVEQYSNYGGKQERKISAKGAGPRRPCPRLWHQMYVLYNGDACICCYDVEGEYLLGNLAHSSIQEVWRGERMNRYRQLHREARTDEIPICRSCNYLSYASFPIWWG